MQFKIKPLNHQLKEYDASKADKARGILWEQGTGKTKLTLDQAAYLYLSGRIDGVLVLAPEGVHLNWKTDEIPKHLNELTARDSSYFVFNTTQKHKKDHKLQAKNILSHHGLAWMFMTYDAIMTQDGKEQAWAFLSNRRTLYILDESPRIKTPKAKRTKTIIKSSKYAPYRRILSGTPIDNSPFDIYKQIEFLDENFWKKNGFPTISAFRSYFGVFKPVYNPHLDKFVDVVCAYRNLEELKSIVAKICSRVLKEQVLDLPRKLYTTRYFSLTREQEKAYKALQEEMVTEVSGSDVIADLPIIQLLRFQQITSGYLPTEDGLEPFHEFENNPRIKLLQEVLEDVTSQTIIWAKYQKDITNIMKLLGDKAVQYDGQIPTEERALNKDKFLAGEAQFFVGNPDVGKEGLTLTCAKTVIYYNNSYKLSNRLQSEDRAHRISQDQDVLYIDLVAVGTVDEDILKSLRRKIDLSSQILGDDEKEWVL
jgi:SNF2 family DNA or RNA helicase